MKSNPWYRSTLHLAALEKNLTLHIPHDVFSTARIDEGTLLLLENLPGFEPESVLDMGCGYGALGLPLAARFSNARIEMVDRDLLAVAWAVGNAQANQLTNVAIHGSLGYRDLTPKTYDWILCNVPARIGRPFIEYLLADGHTRLSAQGELRVVVINDLAPTLEELGAKLVNRGPRHSVFALAGHATARVSEPDTLYLRDSVEIGGLRLERPFDLGGDDPRRLSTGLPVMLDALPRKAPRRVLSFRCGYGALPLIGRARWPEAQIVAVDRDLLATDFTRRNARKLNLSDERLEVRESAHFPDAIRSDEKFDLAIGELSPAAGELVAAAEIEALSKLLDKGGQALLLTLDKLERQWVAPLAERKKFSIARVIARDGYALLRLAATTAAATNR